MRTPWPRAVRRFRASPDIDRLLRHGVRFLRALQAHDALGAAASIAFWFFLSLVPLLVMLGFLLGQVARSKGVDALIAPILDIVPGTAEGLVGKELQRLAGANTSVAPVGVLGFLWTASSGLHNLMDVLETAVQVKRRPWWKQRALAIGWVLVGLATSCALAWVLVRADVLVNAYEPQPAASGSASIAPSTAPSSAPPRTSAHAPLARPEGRGEPRNEARNDPRNEASRSRAANFRRRVNRALHTPAEKLIACVLLLLTGTSFLAGFYRFSVEHPRGVKRKVWPGAIAAVVSWLVISSAFGNYAASIADYALYYGSLAAVAVLLVWLYLTSLSLVVGAEVNAQLEGLRDEARAAR
ncbi:MAG TPA: YihY/virulence factor BrkB family protein [Polyangiaceae bacterium]|nr:YihY/virulence factor BrkB family protein [Polyangiaceae bacterium]